MDNNCKVCVSTSAWDCSKVHLLVEDDGMVHVLTILLPYTNLPAMEIHVVPGGGWQNLAGVYQAMLDHGVPAERIIPVLDSDALGTRGPKGGKVYQSRNMFRFQNDLELVFATVDCMALDHALLALSPSVFGPYGSVTALREWTAIVNAARPASAKGQASTTDGILTATRARLEALGGHPEGFAVPSKVWLACLCSRYCLATATLPPELGRLFARIRTVSGEQVPPIVSLIPPFLQDPEVAIRALGLTGRLLLDSRVFRLPSGEIAPLVGAEDIRSCSWSPTGVRVAGTVVADEGGARRSELVVADAANPADPSQRLYLGPGSNASFVCWGADDEHVLARIPSDRVFLFRIKGTERLVDGEGAYGHSISRQGRLARTVNGSYESIEIISLNGVSGTDVIPGVVDARHGLSWSHSGRYLAFVNTDNEWRGTICVWDSKTKETRFLTPWHGRPRGVAWSPDDRFIAFGLVNGSGVWIVEAKRHSNRTELWPVVRVTGEVGLISGGSWAGDL